MDKMVSDQLKGLSYMAVVMGVIGLMALVLSAVGVAGVMAYSVSQRKRETGIRIALGASYKDVLRMFVIDGLKLLAIGLLIGLPLAFALARLLSNLLYGVGSSDPTSFLAGAGILIIAVFLACYIPSRAATQVDPITALRYE
jgi:putative ABC transport system permease protein